MNHTTPQKDKSSNSLERQQTFNPAELKHTMGRLHKTIHNATDLLQKYSSKKQVFIRGIISGIGASLGATLFAGLILGVLVEFMVGLENLPLLGDHISELVESASLTDGSVD